SATLLAGGGVGVLLALPLGSLVLKLGWVAEPVAGHWERTWSPGHAAAILVHVPVEFAEEWWWTGLLSALTATLVTVGVVPLAWWARRSPARAAVGLGLAALVAAVPGPYFAVLVLVGRVRWGGPGFDWLAEQTVLLPVVVLALRAVPVCGALAWQACRTVSPSMLEVAELAGGSPWRRWWQVVWPSRRRAFLAVWLCGWCLAAGDVATTILLVPPRVSTVAVRTFQLVHAGVDDRLAGLSLWTWLGYAMLAWGVVRLLRRDAEREGGA
ncbi:MAG: hypothetical protein U0935_22670, partial [Pirellulales bacterium]